MYPAVLLNECLSKFVPICMKGRNQKELQRLLAAPYLTYDAHEKDSGFTKEDAETLQLMADDGIVRTPFPVFRFCCHSDNGDEFCGVVEREPNRIQVLCFCRPKSGKSPLFYQVFCERPIGCDEAKCRGIIWDSQNRFNITEHVVMLDANSPEHIKWEAEDSAEIAALAEEEKKSEIFSTNTSLPKEVRLREAQRMLKILNKRAEKLRSRSKELRLGSDSLEGFNKEVSTVIKPLAKTYAPSDSTDLSYIFYEVIKVICYEYLAPQNFMAVVRPDGPGRSVEWLKAREHITLIHRHHEANNAALAAGGVVVSDPTKTVTRCAHSRRAHVKILRSPRFKYKQGQRIFVKASWVGPKQWKDSAGQTYQILVPVTVTPASFVA